MKVRKNVFSCYWVKLCFHRIHRSYHRDWMSAHVSYNMEGVMLLVVCQDYPSGNIKDE